MYYHNYNLTTIISMTVHVVIIILYLKLGFDFHHAQSGYAMLTKWLPEDEPNKLPLYASHYLGKSAYH